MFQRNLILSSELSLIVVTSSTPTTVREKLFWSFLVLSVESGRKDDHP
jgi:hypothetical protein